MTNSVRTLVLTGHITAVGPLTTVRPDDKFHTSDRVGRLPRAGAKVQATPVYLSAAALRGRLRRIIRNVVREAVIDNTKNPTPFSLDTHYMLTQGVDTTNETKNEKTDGLVSGDDALRAANPALSLCGRWKLPGHWAINDLIPETPNTTSVFIHGAGARTDDFALDPKQAQFLTVEDQERLKRILVEDALSQKDVAVLNAQIKEIKAQIRKADLDEKRALNKQLEELESEVTEIKAAKSGSEESIQRPLDGYEAIVPGTLLKNKITLANVPDLELGLFIDALVNFSAFPFIGGHFLNGCGEITAEWEIKERPVGALKATLVGKIKLSFDGFEFEDYTEDKSIQGAYDTWCAAKKDLAGHGLDFNRFLLKSNAA